MQFMAFIFLVFVLGKKLVPCVVLYGTTLKVLFC